VIRALWLSFLFCQAAQAIELQYLNQVSIPHKQKFQKSKIGGLSGLLWNENRLFAVSDDRGLVNEPRIYEFKTEITDKVFKVEPKETVFFSFNQGPLSHQSTKSKTKVFTKVLDMEGLAITPWGDFLVSNEGDMNHKPRINPQILAVKPDGEIQREFPLPEKFKAEASGAQAKGPQNNMAFEGLAANPNGKQWIAGMEGALVQDNKNYLRLLEWTMAEPFVLNAGKEWAYPLEKTDSLVRGISELVYLDDHRLLVMERALAIGMDGLGFEVEIYLIDLNEGSDISGLEAIPLKGLPKGVKPLVKHSVLNLKKLEDQIGRLENYEGMTLGPTLSDGRRSMILVSDDNFMRDLKTKFLLFAIKE
jgi:hypothetical protein